MIHVIATIDLESGHREDFLSAFRQLVPQVRDETGCIEYGPTIDVDTNIDAQGGTRADTVTVVERWEDLESLEAHLIAPHMIDYRERVKSMIRGMKLQILKPV